METLKHWHSCALNNPDAAETPATQETVWDELQRYTKGTVSSGPSSGLARVEPSCMLTVLQHPGAAFTYGPGALVEFG